MTDPQPGEITLDGAVRAFSVRADKARTLKELVLPSRHGPAPRPVYALRGVTLRIAPGETVGIVGRNGAGKSSTLRVLAGIIPLQAGSVACGGRVVSLLELGAGFSRDFSGRENIYLQGALYGFSRAAIEESLESIIAFSELGEFIDTPIRTYSSGMFLRLGFAIAAHLRADVLLIDEVLAVGDDAFQRKCLRRIAELIADGTTLVLVSHDLPAVERVCRRLIVLDGGSVVFDGDVVEGLAAYRRMMGTQHDHGGSLREPPGEGPEIVELELQDAAERATTVFAPGAAVSAWITVQHAPVGEESSVELTVSTQNGEPLFATRHRLPADQTRATLVFEIPRLALLGGDFVLSARAGAPAVLSSLPAQRAVTFSVTAPDDRAFTGSVDLRGQWRTPTLQEASR